MDNPKEQRQSLYSYYFDKEVPQAGYAAIVYAVLWLISGLLGWAQGSLLHYDLVNEKELQHGPLIGTIAIVLSVIGASISGVLAFFIFRRSRVAIVLMIAFITVLQLFNWFVAHSLTGTLPFIIVTAFLLRGARRMFQDHAERQLEGAKEV
jgi:hypothetical protein